MVTLEVSRSNRSVLRVAGDLAERMGADAIGMAFCQPMQIVYYDGLYSGCEIEQDDAEIKKELKASEGEFHDMLGLRARRLEWRASVTYSPLAEDLADNAWAADLVIAAPWRPTQPAPPVAP